MKNKFIFFDYSLWHKFIRDLLYPGILGSLIYDLAKFQFEHEFYLLIITTAFYVIDYFYMNYTLKNKVESCKARKIFMLLLDLLIAVIFMCIIYAIHNQLYLRVLFLTFVISIGALIYSVNNKHSLIIIILLIVLSSLIVYFEYTITKFCQCNEFYLMFGAYSMIVFLYALAVTLDYYYDKKLKDD